MNTFVTVTAMAVGLPTGFWTPAEMDPFGDESWGYPDDPPDDELPGDGRIDDEAKPEEAAAGPGVSAATPELPRVDRPPRFEVC